MLLEKSGPLNKGILFIEIEESENKLKREKKERKKRVFKILTLLTIFLFLSFFPPFLLFSHPSFLLNNPFLYLGLFSMKYTRDNLVI